MQRSSTTPENVKHFGAYTDIILLQNQVSQNNTLGQTLIHHIFIKARNKKCQGIWNNGPKYANQKSNPLWENYRCSIHSKHPKSITIFREAQNCCPKNVTLWWQEAKIHCKYLSKLLAVCWSIVLCSCALKCCQYKMETSIDQKIMTTCGGYNLSLHCIWPYFKVETKSNKKLHILIFRKYVYLYVVLVVCWPFLLCSFALNIC